MSVRPTRVHDLCELKDALSEDAVAQLAAHGLLPERGLLLSVAVSQQAYTVERNGDPIAIFGFAESAYRESRNLWMMVTDQVFECPTAFVRTLRACLVQALEQCPELFGLIDEPYERTVELVRVLGGQVEEPKPVGPGGRMACRYWFRKEKSACA